MERSPPSPEKAALKLCAIGSRLAKLKEYDRAAAAFQAAVAIRPGFADAWNDLGTSHQQAGRVAEAMAAYGRALAIDPAHAKALSNLGAAHMQRNEPALAIDAFNRALGAGGPNPKIHANLAFAQLLAGDLLQGWRNYENRWAAGATRPAGPPAREPWLGNRPLKGRSILLRQEQGFGDMIQFARYIPRVAALGARVHVEVPRPLQRLFTLSFPGVEAVHAAGGPMPECDEVCPITSLALAFSTDLASIPAAVPYLRAPARPAAVRAALDASPGVPRIGIAWSGDPKHHNDANRSIPFARFRALVDGSGLPFVSLQREVRAGDDEALRSAAAVADLRNRMRDFADTAALADELDLVVAVDTSIAHLAGALGKETWVLLPFAPDWRWMLRRHDSPWYPTMRLFRQPREGDWDSVFAEVLAALARRFPGGRRPPPARR